VTWDPLSRKAIELLARGHSLYGADHFGAGPADAPDQLRQRADRLVRSNGAGMGAAANLRMAAGLRRTAAADGELAAALADAGTEHETGRQGSQQALDAARSDSMPAADTPLGRQEALRRMAARLRRQRRYLHRSHRSARLLARRLRGLGYPHRRHTPVGLGPRAAALPLAAVRYEKAFAPGHVRQRIAAALDHLGITDPTARRNWLRGYETLIARESGGRPSVVAPEPATVPGAVQPDGRGLGFARGIAQTIPATFARYHQPGTSTNIYDPVANICASMNYVIHRYGVSRNGENLAAMVQQADAHRPPKGY
jgi:SLT domain-containing protein